MIDWAQLLSDLGQTLLWAALWTTLSWLVGIGLGYLAYRSRVAQRVLVPLSLLTNPAAGGVKDNRRRL